MNIGELRKWLDEREAEWTETDDQYLGTFESQQILTDYHTLDSEGNIQYSGIGPAKLIEYYELGLIFAPEEFHGRSKKAGSAR